MSPAIAVALRFFFLMPLLLLQRSFTGKALRVAECFTATIFIQPLPFLAVLLRPQSILICTTALLIYSALLFTLLLFFSTPFILPSPLFIPMIWFRTDSGAIPKVVPRWRSASQRTATTTISSIHSRRMSSKNLSKGSTISTKVCSPDLGRRRSGELNLDGGEDKTNTVRQRSLDLGLKCGWEVGKRSWWAKIPLVSSCSDRAETMRV
jgi:hypothetical protein